MENVNRRKTINRDELVSLMRSRQGDKTNAAFAVELGISPSYLGEIYMGKREPGPSVLEALGYERETVYSPSESNAAD